MDNQVTMEQAQSQEENGQPEGQPLSEKKKLSDEDYRIIGMEIDAIGKAKSGWIEAKKRWEDISEKFNLSWGYD